ncbi:MAG: response regulator [Anaerolineae bacterium]|nr:response regulator [Anaerolineae bacterium]
MPEKAQILIVEDDLDLAEMLNSYFKVQGYDVTTAAWGEEAVEIGTQQLPSLVVLDIRLPDIDGYEVCRRFRNNRRTADIPIIFLTEKRDRVDKLAGLELGVVDYITKPFDIQELRLRVRNALKRANLTTLVNPVTGLPEGQLVDEHLEELLQVEAGSWAALAASIDGLIEFRESHGFIAADDVLRAVSLMISNAVREAGNPDDFLGHLGLGDFLIVANKARVETIRERIQTRIHRSIEYLYPLQDQEKALKAIQEDRLRLVLSCVVAEDGPFESVDGLKARLLGIRQVPEGE